MNTTDYIKTSLDRLKIKTFYKKVDHEENIENKEIMKNKTQNLLYTTSLTIDSGKH